MLRKIPFLLLAIAIVLGVNSCKKDNDEDPDTGPKNLEDLVIPEGFRYETSQFVQVNITDNKSGVIYDIYTIPGPDSEIIYGTEDTTVAVDDLNRLVASGMTNGNQFSTAITVPAYHKYLHIVRNDKGSFYSQNVAVSPIVNFTYSGQKSVTQQNNIIYAVNSQKGFYAIDAVTGQVTDIGPIPVKSIACAVDEINRRVYFANQQSPHQLMYYHIDNETFHTVGNLHGSFPRMEYNHKDGILYISGGSKLYKVNPLNCQYLQTYNINGLHNTGWGDMAFDEFDNLFILSKSGVYATVFSGNTIQATRISPSDLPSPMTSAAFDDDGMLWMSKSPNQGKVVLFNTNTATWEYKNTSISVKINDFGSLTAISTAGDADGDEVPDDQDDYPNDPTKAFDNYSPGENIWATLAYEDLWPGKGDYDFNDLVLYYRINQITNAQNFVVEIVGTFYVKHIGATLDNGFAMEIPISPSDIQSVTGTLLTEGYVNLAANGTETGQTNAVVYLFDNADPQLGKTLTLTIKLANQKPAYVLGAVPYNPFLVKDGNRGYEIHLPDKEPTDLADLSVLGTFNDNSIPAQNRYYKTENNLPWGINIVYEFVHPLENHEITKGYLKFADWAESGGSLYQDWYKDEADYRDNEHLDTNNK